MKNSQNSTKIKQPSEKWTEALKRLCSKEEIQVTQSYMKKCPTFLINRGMQMKTTVRHQIIPLRMTYIYEKMKVRTSASEDMD